MRAFSAPPQYLQGPDALDRIGSVCSAYGTVSVVVTDAHVRELLGDRVERLMRGSGLDSHVLVLPGELTYPAVDALVRECHGLHPTVVVGLGGGKALDAAKAVSLHLSLPVVTVPTVASNDSPTSGAIAMYDDDHTLISVDRLPRGPVAVLVDTRLVAAAPSHFLRAGIGDAISKKLEADGCRDGSGNTPLGTRPLLVAGAVADRCYETLRQHAVRAVSDCDDGAVTDALEATVEAVVLLSGLAFENGGLSLAHSLTRGLMRVDGASTLPHGFHVAWGALVQLAAEGRPDAEVSDLASFLRSLGLPVSSKDLGLHDPVLAAFEEIARHTMTAPHLSNVSVVVDAAGIVEAAHRVDVLSARLPLGRQPSGSAHASPGAPYAM